MATTSCVRHGGLAPRLVGWKGCGRGPYRQTFGLSLEGDHGQAYLDESIPYPSAFRILSGPLFCFGRQTGFFFQFGVLRDMARVSFLL